MPFTPHELLALAVAISFAAGLNLSAVLLTLGLLSQTDILTLPAPIAIVGEWWVIAVSAALFLLESFADKIPGFDVIWNALLTVIRVPAGALLAFAATDSLSSGLQIAAAAGGGALTLAAHGAKTALRGSVSASPEPFSNWALSFVDDALAIGVTWFAAEHPYLAATLALLLIACAFLLVRWIVRAVRASFRSTGRDVAHTSAVVPPPP